MRDRLDALCRLHGIVAPPMPDGRWGAVLSPRTQHAVLQAIGVDPEAPDALNQAAALDPPTLAAPAGTACFTPAWLAGSGAWGIAVQLYELRSGRNWGIGDFADLAALATIAANAGADFLGLNPLHALFGADPARASPFSPSNRRFLNPLYIAVDRVEGFDRAMVDQAQIEAMRDTAHVDYAGVWALKSRVLQEIWQAKRHDHDLDRFIAQGGEALRLHCVFEAISAHMASRGHGAGWRGWPQAFQDPRSQAVADFAAGNPAAIGFHQWLQYLADRQLAAAQESARNAGMRIGLYLDLAVGEAPDGSACWSDASTFLADATVGAPPDMFTANGQLWGLTTISPLQTRRSRGEALRPVYESAMRHAGAVRLDHAMGIWQLFLVPQGLEAADGAYARLPADRVLAVLADLSKRHRAILVGEDLGIVPEGFRAVLERANVLSYRVLYFEQDDDGFAPASTYPSLALACIATHDLPTMRGWWAGLDIDLREQFGLVASDVAQAQRKNRVDERAALCRMVALDDPDLPAAPDIAPELVVAAHRFIARTPSRLAVARFADLAGETQPTNVPGTDADYPNWRHKCAVPVEALEAAPLFGPVTRAMRQQRPKP